MKINKTRKEEVDKAYRTYEQGVNVNTVDSSKYQANSENKTRETFIKGTALATVLAVLTGTGISACHKRNEVPVVEPTTIAGNEVPGDNQESYDYVLVENFSLDESKLNETLEKLANDIMANVESNGQYNKDDIKLIIKMCNGILTKDDFNGMSDEEIAKKVSELLRSLYSIFSDGASKLSRANENNKEYEGLWVSSRAILAKTDYGTKLANIKERMVEAKKDEEALYKIGLEFIKIYDDIRADKKLSKAEKYVLYSEMASMTPQLSFSPKNEKKTRDLKDILLNNRSDFYESILVDKLSMNKDVLDRDAVKTSEAKAKEEIYTTTYRKPKDADKYAGTSKYDKPKKIENDKKKPSNTTERHEIPGTTKEPERLPDKEVTTKPGTTTPPSTTESGGDLVEEETSIKLPEIEDEEDVAPGVEEEQYQETLYSLLGEQITVDGQKYYVDFDDNYKLNNDPQKIK